MMRFDFTRRAAIFTTALLCGAGFTGALHAQATDYPNRAVTLVVPSPPGDGSDVLGRLLAQELSTSLKQPFTVDNRPGAGGILASDRAAKSKPDGYTLLLGNASSHAVVPALYTKLTYSPQKDFAPVVLVATAPNVLVVGSELPVNTVAEFIAYAKARPGKLNIASAGNGSLSHLAAEMFKNMADIDMVHVPYKGATPALTDVAAGHVAAMIINIPTVQPLLKGGKLKALATSGATRAPSLPDIPTLDEAGVKGYEASAWFGLFAPTGTPPAVIEKLRTESVRALQVPAMRNSFAAQGLIPVGNTSAEFVAHIQKDVEKYTRIVRIAKITID
ncbi:Bug family tripartite tricarboxylate transporter substrate binding protein [Ottowia thiooxydans]|uniref:Bug family tripartite tricarboxylate transporter substrate binding protein n=1 Tax=Ottowia thiooxydans TaxID=219182 RepID=UPI0003F5435E|nr:tripartite tricarboxylate transporter substrate binding protein [Ottowia thiooxydans]